MTLIEAVKVTYAMLNQDATDVQIAATVAKLQDYPALDVQLALSRCQDELKKMSFSDILDRMPSGHPGPEVAWATIARSMGNEAITLVWTDQMREAYGVASQLADDPVQARMAFKEQYQESVKQARQAGTKPVWTVSLGHDVQGRELAVSEAVAKGQITYDHAKTLVPMLPPPSPAMLEIAQQVSRC